MMVLPFIKLLTGATIIIRENFIERECDQSGEDLCEKVKLKLYLKDKIQSEGQFSERGWLCKGPVVGGASQGHIDHWRCHHITLVGMGEKKLRI